MKRIHHRNCKNCKELFLPDRRNLRHQTYCSKPPCRQASKKDSQRRWLAKPSNRDYFRGAAHVARVQAWRAAHPGYWRRHRPQTSPALQEHYHPQEVDLNKEIATLPSQMSGNDTALQDLLRAQPFVLIGLIAKLTGSALQEDIVLNGHRLQQLGRDILQGGLSHEQSRVVPPTGASDPGPI